MVKSSLFSRPSEALREHRLERSGPPAFSTGPKVFHRNGEKVVKLRDFTFDFPEES